ncbi:MAG: right-handed parallel beta-helix repeat-containing protein [Blastocatellia bacterium]|nr:right-handed parallel beta-helix repeat-containing protein [Blastocatellia bacterium]
MRGNLSVNAGGPGFDTSGSTGGNIFENNTVTGNGTLTNGQTSGLRIQGSNNTIRKNIIGNNYGAGILVRYATTNTGNVITQNSIFANGTTGGSPSKQIGIDLVATASESGNTGTFPFVTVNDANDADSGPNDLLNFPVFESVTVSGSNLVLRGCAPSGATIEFFESDVSFGKSSAPGANTNTPRTLDYGEGETYLGTLTEGGVGDSDSGSGCPATDGNNQTGMARFSFTIPLPAGVISGDLLTATATVSGVGTSEFSPVSPVAAAVPNVSLVKSCPSPSDCTTSPQLPETDITYRIDFTNAGGQGASNLRIIDAIPDNMDYKLGTATVTSGVAFTITFSTDYDPLNPTAATWTYTPVSGGGNATVGFASAGYDRLVKAIRWSANAAIPNTSPNNTGNVSFIAKIR